MLENFGKVYQFGYEKIIDDLESKKMQIKFHFEANKDAANQAFERVFVILKEAKLKFDFSYVFAPKYELIDRTVYLSNSSGVKAWSFPPDKQMNWDNPLT